MTRINAFLLAICSLLIAGIIGYKDYFVSNQFYFVIDIEASATGISQIFFDTGRGYNEQDSNSLQLQRGTFQKYSFPLPALAIKSIRFDPTRSPALISIKNARIENAQGQVLKNFPVQSFMPLNQISSMEISENALAIQTTDNDPITVIENSWFGGKITWRVFFAQRGWIYACYALLSFIILMGLVKCRQQITDPLDRMVIYLSANPAKTITLIGLVATIISCYPVVFFGMSFVSPAGMNALYASPPWIPGFSFDGRIENFRGSDVWATALSIAPNTVVQHDALFRYFEFPFWNRYLGAGIPLFAQGQSMIGDILHWIPVLLDGSSIGWDIKFLLSKALFAVGMGLLVYRLTGQLLAGALIAITSCFLGFFAYQFNHPAFFVLTYAPWVVLQWDRLGRVLALPDPRIRSAIAQGLILVALTWLQLNAGSPKEGVITACFVQALGVMAFWVHTSPKWGRIRPIAFAGVFGLAMVMLAAPYWLLFLDALGKSFTEYDVPGVETLPPWAIVGFFDNFFFQQFWNDVKAPSANLFVLLCVSSALLSLRLRQSSLVYGSWGLFILAMATAYGLIPKSILTAIPLINKIQHVGETFSIPMMVLALILAGYGIRDYLGASAKFKKTIVIFALPSFLGLWLAYALNVEGWSNTVIFAMVNIAVALIGFVQLYRHAESGAWQKGGLIILMCCFLLLHVRHGMHLQTGLEEIDAYVTNPTARGDYSIKSDAIEYVKKNIDQAKEPTRVIGEGIVLFQGFNSRLTLEGVNLVEAVRNKNYQKLLVLVDYPEQGWPWLRYIKSDQIASRAAALDMLGIGYIVAEVGTQMPPDMKLVHTSDLNVWQRESVWPRAFFVNQIVEVRQPEDILTALKDKSHTPFAAVESQFIPPGVRNNDAPYRVVPAGEYRLTNNSTRFSVEASGPGLIVLGETYYPGDFVAEVNGEKVDYVRVNEAFKGIWVNKAGKYEVNFTYRPEKLNQAIAICLLGLILLLLIIRMSVGIPGRFKK